MRKAAYKKSLAFVATIVFLNLAIISTINFHSSSSEIGVRESYVNDNTRNYKEMQEKLIEAEIIEYNPNGLTEKKIVALSESKANELKNKLMSTETMDERFSILQKYGLIDKISLDRWKEGMYKKAAEIGLMEDNVKKISPKYVTAGIFNLPILLNFFCKVNAIYIISGGARLGLPPIMGFTKFLGSSRVFSFDLMDMCWGVFGVLETKGLLRNHALATIPSFMCLAGFVGIHVHIPFILDLYNGFSAMAFAVGLGLHTINLNLATATLLGVVIGALIGQIIFGSTGSET